MVEGKGRLRFVHVPMFIYVPIARYRAGFLFLTMVFCIILSWTQSTIHIYLHHHVVCSLDGTYKAANQLPLPVKLYTLMFSSFPHPQPLLKNRELI